MLPVTSINNQKLSDGKKGEIFLKLIDEWSKSVNVDIPKQIHDF